MKISAKIVADSVSPAGHRLTSVLMVYPRFVHGEVMTHRQFSRNAASSRAIPIKKMIEAVEYHPAGPVWWGKNQSGMQAVEELSPGAQAEAKYIWIRASRSAISYALQLDELGVHKQIVNRLLEPFQWMTTLVTSSEWHNFFALRAHEDAQPEFQELAYATLEAYLGSEPALKDMGQWHIPFGDRMPEGLRLDTQLKVATARCARLSYLTFDGDINVDKDVALHDRLAASGHWSPFEHCAEACPHSWKWGNFRGWGQYRKSFAGECRQFIDLAERLRTRKQKRGAPITSPVLSTLS